MGEHLAAKERRFVELVANGETILVNNVGGYCTYDPDYYTIINVRETEIPKNYVINEGTKYINLENDPELEQHAIDYLERVDQNYSYITNLASHDYHSLVEIFGEFLKAGGDTVYVFTTGMNVEQMYEYESAARHAGIRKFEFEFNSGINNDIQKFIDYLKPLANVKILGE
jgi:hypothetical protein